MLTDVQVGRFPFGQPVRRLAQVDRTQKRVFVLGSHPDTVHARWVHDDGGVIAPAIPVAGEPELYWRGQNTDQILSDIHLPAGLGTLQRPESGAYNGALGVAIEQWFLKPMNLTRDDAWFCDLVPWGCIEKDEQDTVRDVYAPLARKWQLPEAEGIHVPRPMADNHRREEILDELEEARAILVMILGDAPVKHFVKHLAPQWASLNDFGSGPDEYGRPRVLKVRGRWMRIVPLADPRTVLAGGKWSRAHHRWAVNPSV